MQVIGSLFVDTDIAMHLPESLKSLGLIVSVLALMDFPPLRKDKRHLRDYGIRFFYTGSVANTGQYWNLPQHERSLTMVKYEFPGRTTTFQEDNISSKDLVVFDAEYVAGQFEANVDAQPQVHPFTLKIMTEKFGDKIAN